MKEIPSYLYSSNNGYVGETAFDEEVENCCRETTRAIEACLRYEECIEDNDVKINYLKKLLSIRNHDIDTNDYLLFLLNNGKYRTDEEIENYNQKVRRHNERIRIEKEKQADYEYFTSGQYEEDCGESGWVCWMPTIVSIIIAIIAFPDVLVSMISVFVGLLISLIASALNSQRCIDIADEHKYYKNTSERYKKEKLNRTISTTGAIAGVTSLGKGIKDAHKEISNPDSWPKI